MPNLVRGGAVLMLLGLFVVFVYSQSNSEQRLIIANDSQKELNSTAVQQNQTNSEKQTNTDKKLVKTTGLVTAVKAGSSKGSFTATAYCLSGRTALGHGVRRGIIAADPRILRLGSKIALNAGNYTGQYLVSDTGGGVKGRRIDIWVPSCAEARRFGRRSVTVNLLD
jgi:3D (Asp-Asp-Asp) domain-containing protein